MGALKLLRSSILWGVLLILGGAALLVDNVYHLNLGAYFWGIVTLVTGVIFIAEFVGSGRASWWALIPGVSLLGLAATIFVGELFPAASEMWGGALFLGGIGLAFFLVYFADRNNWWAIIPGGVLGTLAVVSFMDASNQRLVDSGSIFFVGLGLTFLLVALLPTPQGKMTWAYIPGGILLVFGLLILAARTDLLVIIGPAALIVIGLALVVRAFWK